MHRSAVGAVAAVLVLAVVPQARSAREEGAAARRIEIVAARYTFTPAVIDARQGEVLELALRSADTTHGLAIKPYGVKVAIPKGGETVSVRFVADKPGRFPIECSEYCGSGHKRMRGELVVAEAGR